MSHGPRSSASSNFLYGIVCGGHDSDPDPSQASLYRVYFPGIHGKNVNIKDLNFSTSIKSPDKGTQQTFSGGLDPGTMVVAVKDTGSNQCQILGLVHDINNPQPVPGNIDLLAFSNIAKFMTEQIKVNIPPNIQKSSDGGAEVFKIIEKGIAHSHNLLKGLPTHGALFPMSGSIVDQIKNISTAIQADGGIPGANVIAALPGISMSLGGLLNMITSNANLSRKLNQSMVPTALSAFTSMSVMIQSIEQTESAGFMPASKVDPDVFAENAITLLSQSTNISDVVSVMGQLQSNPALTGMSAYGPTIIEQETPFGNIVQSYRSDGKQMSLTPASVAQAASLMSSVMSGAGFPSSIPGVSMFGQSSGTILNMMQRIPGGGFNQALALANILNQSGVAQQVFSVAQEVFNGGNPLNKLIGG
jgi:hypothetical protein